MKLMKKVALFGSAAALALMVAAAPAIAEEEETENYGFRNETVEKVVEKTVDVLNTDFSAYSYGFGLQPTEDVKLNMDVKIARVNVESGADAGYFHIKGADGDVSTGYGVQAEAVFETTVVNGNASVEVGDEDYNVGGSVQTDLLKAKAKGYALAGVVDGQLNVDVEAGLEAILAETGVEGKVTIDGVEVSGGVKLKTGIGMKVEGGFEKGHLKFEGGITAGVGVEVDVDIDIGAIAEKVAEPAQEESTANKISDACQRENVPGGVPDFNTFEENTTVEEHEVPDCGLGSFFQSAVKKITSWLPW